MFALSKKLRSLQWALSSLLAGMVSLHLPMTLQRSLGRSVPNQPIVTKVGRKGVIAFYEADGSHLRHAHCDVGPR